MKNLKKKLEENMLKNTKRKVMPIMEVVDFGMMV